MADPVLPSGVTLSRLPAGEKRLIRSSDPARAETPSAEGWACHAIAPGEWFLVRQADDGPAADLPPGHDPSTGRLTVDASAAWVGFRLSGPAARSVAAKGTFADLGDPRPEVARWITCRFGHFRVHLHLDAGGDLTLHVERSQAEAVAALLREFGAEFGMQAP